MSTGSPIVCWRQTLLHDITAAARGSANSYERFCSIHPATYTVHLSIQKAPADKVEFGRDRYLDAQALASPQILRQGVSPN